MLGRKLVAANVRRIRVDREISQERLAFDSGVDRSYLGGMERGEANPTVDILDRIAATLGISLAELFAETDETEAPIKGLPRGRKQLTSLRVLRLSEPIEATTGRLHPFAKRNPLRQKCDRARIVGSKHPRLSVPIRSCREPKPDCRDGCCA